jgi:hypothetical protein
VDATDVPTTWRITVTPTGGDVGIALFASTLQHFQIGDAISIVNANGADTAEYIDYKFPAAGYYGLVIYKPNNTQASNSINYTLDITTSGIAETPDGNIIPGVPLKIAKSGSSLLELNWGHSCDNVPGVTHYAIYRGTIASLISGSYNHASVLCDSGTDNTETITSDTGSYYYLIVPTDNLQEGGYGFESGGASRPAAASPCLPQNRINCP